MNFIFASYSKCVGILLDFLTVVGITELSIWEYRAISAQSSDSGPTHTHTWMYIFRISMMNVFLMGLGREKNQRHIRLVSSNITRSHLLSADYVLLLLLLLSRFSHVWLCDPIDSSPPGSPVPGILQARTLEWVALSFSNAWKWKVKVKLLSHVRLFEIPWTATYQAPPSMGFSRQEYWSGVPSPSPDYVLGTCIYIIVNTFKTL